METIGIGLLGLGTVGSGVVKALEMNNKSIVAKLTAVLGIKRILVRDLDKHRAVDVAKQLLTTDFQRILDDPEIGIIVDAMGGIEPAREYILAAIERGKHVVTANKEVIAKYGREILAAAQAKGVGVYFEASVGGGIPIIRPLKHCLQANEIEEIMGIINGTTNYILTKMATEGRDFAAILKEAQDKGYAEPDPTNDVEGYDAAYKLAILTSLAFGTPTGLGDIPFQGISSITRDDMAWAGTLGYTIKLLAVAKDHGEGLEARVAPCLLPREHPLAKVNDVFNGIYVKGNLVGELLLTGRGAGDLPTASAVVADIMDIAKVVRNGNSVGDACTCYRYKPFLPLEKLTASYYVRVKVSRTDAVIAVNNLLTQEQIPCEVALKKLQQGRSGTVIYFTGLVSEGDMEGAAKKLRSLHG
ncbi:MAG TPA: homoserine dehydrogenase, partial [Verrucomicrobiae bacterium]|nr:homoserine dehydrogenase [Verrucomicrobiae bacterium]